MTATWTVVVEPPDEYELQPVAGNPTTVEVTSTLPDGFAVVAADPDGDPVSGVQVLFDAAAAGGTFPGGALVEEVTTGADGIARSPAFTAGTQAGTMAVTVDGGVAPTLLLPLTVTAAEPYLFVPTSGDLQTTPINTTFPNPLAGHYVDQQGNVVTEHLPPEWSEFTADGGIAAWPDGSNVVSVQPAADGTITLPALHVGSQVPAMEPPGQPLYGITSVSCEPDNVFCFFLRVTPGPPHAVTATGGDGQETGTSQPFAQPLTARLTDAAGNPISGATVTFEVTSGSATFPPLELDILASVIGDPAIALLPNPPRDTVTVPTDANGVATAPVLTAGQEAGQIIVTASSGGTPAATNAVFTLTAVSVAPTAPSITGLGNGDGQVSVSFSDASTGTSRITSYEVTATNQSDPGAPPVTATGPRSPILVTGLTNGDTYVFTVTATSAGGTSPPSAPSGALNVGVGPVVVSGPANGTLGQPYSSGFTISGAPPPTVTQFSGDLPPGLTLAGDGALTGTPTAAGSFTFTVQVANDVNTIFSTVTVAISSGTGVGDPGPEAPAPALTSVMPTSGPAGTVVTIGGAGFAGTSDVLFGGVEALFTVVSDTQLRAVVPRLTGGAVAARAAQGLGLPVPVVVVGPGGTSNALTFTYTPGVSAPGGCDPLVSPCGAVPDQPGAPPTVAPAAGDDGAPAVAPAPMPNLRASASARWSGGFVRVRVRVRVSDPGLVRHRVAVRISIPALGVRKDVRVRLRGQRVRTLRLAFRAPVGVIGKRVLVMVDPADLVVETGERDNAASARIR